jgi:topoisomerase-4 subunit A
LVVLYDRAGGFIGCKMSTAQPEIEAPCSELDRLLLIFRDGSYKVIPVPEKLFVGSELIWAGAVRKDLVFNIIYRAGAVNLSYVKRFRAPKFILNKEYRLFEAHKRSAIQLLLVGEKGLRARVSLAPSTRARSNVLEIDFDDYLIKGEAAQGKRISSRAVRRVTDITGQPKQQTETAPVLPALPELNIAQQKK